MSNKINWRPLEGHSINTAFSGYSAAPYFTGQPDMGWCLYVHGGGCWQQRTKPELPPKPGMLPKRIDGAWVWSEPAPTPPNLAQSMAEEITAEVGNALEPEDRKRFCAHIEKHIIQRRIEPLVKQLSDASALLERALPACEYSKMKWKDKEGREDKVKLPGEIQAFLKAKGKL